MRVLIADDDIDSRRLLSKYLRSWHHEVVTANDGDEAMEVLFREPIGPVVKRMAHRNQNQPERLDKESSIL
jgi:CheY-like chemotaxis protein